MRPSILTSSLKNASFNILFQICRLVMIFLNTFIVRHLDQALLGVINVRLSSLESMILSLSRESFMKACLTNMAEHNWAQVVNLVWLAVPICLVNSLFFGYIWLFWSSVTETLPPYYTFAVCAVGLSCIIELSSLIVQLVVNAFLFVKFKIVLDAIMIATHTIIVPLMLYYPENALLAFGIVKLVAATIYTTSHFVYFYYYIANLNKDCPSQKRRMSLRDSGDEYVVSDLPFRSVKDFLPGQLENNDTYFDEKLTSLTRRFFVQEALKQSFLTLGDQLIMTFMPVMTFAEQGIYNIVINLGSLVVKVIFRPIEESGYFYFTQIVKRDKSLSDQNPAEVQESVNVLTHLCSTVTSIGLIVLVFGYSYSSFLLWLYGGSKLILPLPISLMKTYCVAILLFGINGVTECYTNATVDSVTITKSYHIMFYESMVYLGVLYLFVTWFGPVGFIFGDCVNMTLRIIRSALFINKRHRDTIYPSPLRGLIPKPIFFIALSVAAFITYLSEVHFFETEKILHLLIGIIMFMIVLASWIYENYELVRLAINLWYTRKNKQGKND